MKNPIKQFESFLKEATQEKKYKILVISSEPKESKMFHTAERFAKEGKAEGHKVYIVKVENPISVNFCSFWDFADLNDNNFFFKEEKNPSYWGCATKGGKNPKK